MKITYSNSYEAKKSRIKRLLKLGDDIVSGSIKKDAEMFINEFKNGIKNDSFGLDKLADISILSKKRKGFSQPETPLYGKGERRKKDTYINMLRLKRLKKGWKIYPSKQMHWSGKIKLFNLFQIHEYGCKIKHGDSIIQIPPRPAFKLAYQKYLSEKSKNRKETANEVQKAIIEFFNNSNTNYLNKLLSKSKEKGNETD